MLNPNVRNNRMDRLPHCRGEEQSALIIYHNTPYPHRMKWTDGISGVRRAKIVAVKPKNRRKRTW